MPSVTNHVYNYKSKCLKLNHFSIFFSYFVNILLSNYNTWRAGNGVETLFSVDSGLFCPPVLGLGFSEDLLTVGGFLWIPSAAEAFLFLDPLPSDRPLLAAEPVSTKEFAELLETISG